MIKIDETWMDQLYEIMEEAFPMEERRSKEEQRKLFQDPNYHVYAILDQEVISAFLAGWDLGSTHFIEHLATTSEKRGTGIGKTLLMQYMAMDTQAIVLEVEKPTTEIAKRRIGFYERLGFHLYPHIPYVQPSFHKGMEDLPLHLMYSSIQDDEVMKQVIADLYTKVYKRGVPCI